jgi:hypothetical protein
MKRIQFLTVLLLCFCSAYAQYGSLKGYIRDQENGAPLHGVNIHISDKGTTSDQLGYFLIAGLTPGQYQLELSYVGYTTEILKVNVPENKTVEVAVNIRRSSLNLENVVVSGSSTGLVSSLVALDIQLRPVNTSQDILRMVPGLFIAQHAGGGKAEQIFLRGYDLDHGTDINISVDGMPVNMVSHAHGQGYADLHFLEPELVDKVTFEKGPYNTMYGNFATSAFVAFSTPEFLKEQYAKIEAGEFNTQRLATAVRLYNKQTNKIREQWYASGAYSKTDGYFDKPQNFNRLNFFTKYTAAFTDKTLLSISASTFSSNWDASGQIPQRAIDRGLITKFGSIDSSEGGNTSRTNIDTLLQYHFNDHWSLSNRVYYSHYKFNLFSNFTFYLNDPVNGDEIQQKENRDLYGLNGSLSYNGAIGNRNYHGELGYGFRYDNVSDIELNDTIDRVLLNNVQNGQLKEANVFTYFNNTIDLGERLELNAGLRYDWFNFAYHDKLIPNSGYTSQQRDVASPKINLTYSASKTLRLFISTGIGFHSNDSRVILDARAGNILPKVYGVDAGALLKPMPGLLVKAAAWWLYSEQEFVYVGDEGIIEPGGETRRYGADLSARYQFNKWLFSDIDLNWTKARAVAAPKGQDYVPLAAVFTSIGGLTAKNERGLSGSLRYRNISNRPANEDNSVIANGYFLLDALVSYRWKALEFTLSAQNLLNSEWKEAQFDTTSRLKDETVAVSEIHFTPGTPRFIKGGVTVHF